MDWPLDFQGGTTTCVMIFDYDSHSEATIDCCCRCTINYNGAKAVSQLIDWSMDWLTEKMRLGVKISSEVLETFRFVGHVLVCGDRLDHPNNIGCTAMLKSYKMILPCFCWLSGAWCRCIFLYCMLIQEIVTFIAPCVLVDYIHVSQVILTMCYLVLPWFLKMLQILN